MKTLATTKLVIFVLLFAAGLFPSSAWTQEPPDAPNAPQTESGATAPETADEAVKPADEPPSPGMETEGSEPSSDEETFQNRIRREAVVSIGRSVHVKSNEVAETVVVIGGS